MRISFVRATAALIAALICSPGTVWAQNASVWQEGSSTPAYGSSAFSSNGNGGLLTSYYEAEAPAAEAATAATTASGGCGCVSDFCCDDIGNWRDNTLVSIGGEAFKTIGDTFPAPGPAADYMNSAGFVGTFNTGFALWSLENIRGQAGGSYGVYDLKGRPNASNSSSEQQTFVTLGVYKRGDVCCDDRLSWGLVYDQMWDHQYGRNAGEVYLGQVRGIAGWATSEYNEFGVWGAFRTTGDNSDTGMGFGGPLRAMNQYNVYWRRNYDFGGQTMLYIGGNDPADLGSWQFGALGQAPLNDSLALYGNFVFAQPGSSTGVIGSNEQEWAFGVGLTYYLGAKAVSPSVTGRKGLPLLPVANNGSFLITN